MEDVFSQFSYVLWIFALTIVWSKCTSYFCEIQIVPIYKVICYYNECVQKNVI